MSRVFQVSLEWHSSSDNKPEKGESLEQYLRRNFARTDPQKYIFLVWDSYNPSFREIELTDELGGEEDLILQMPRPHLLAAGVTDPEETP